MHRVLCKWWCTHWGHWWRHMCLARRFVSQFLSYSLSEPWVRDSVKEYRKIKLRRKKKNSALLTHDNLKWRNLQVLKAKTHLGYQAQRNAQKPRENSLFCETWLVEKAAFNLGEGTFSGLFLINYRAPKWQERKVTQTFFWQSLENN